MYKGFNVKLGDDNPFEFYQAIGLAEFKQDKTTWKNHLEEYSQNGVINAAKLQDAWFAQRHADVFISHSHSDINLAASVAGWLKTEFGLTSFIDSAVWGHAEALQRQLDDAHNLDTKTRTYNYKASNRACAHVHMMLCGALSSMLHRTECVFFLNTPSSIVTEDAIKDSSGALTASPWIYYELITTKFIEKYRPSRHIVEAARSEKTQGSTIALDSLEMVHTAEIEHLIDIDSYDLKQWRNRGLKTTDALDYLYKMNSKS